MRDLSSWVIQKCRAFQVTLSPIPISPRVTPAVAFSPWRACPRACRSMERARSKTRSGGASTRVTNSIRGIQFQLPGAETRALAQRALSSRSFRYTSYALLYSITRATSEMNCSSWPARRRRWKPISMPLAMPPAVTMAAGVDDASAADARLGRDVRQPVDGDLAGRSLLRPVRLCAVGGGQAVEQAHLPVDPRARADAGQQARVGERADELVQPPVVQLLPRAVAAGDEERVHGG